MKTSKSQPIYFGNFSVRSVDCGSVTPKCFSTFALKLVITTTAQHFPEVHAFFCFICKLCRSACSKLLVGNHKFTGNNF